MKHVWLLSVVLLAGCSNSPENGQAAKSVVVAETPAPPVRVTPNQLSASEMVKKYPKLQKICDLAGGCQNVEIECHRYDGTGNSNLRNETVWHVTALGIEGMGFSSMGGFPQAIGSKYPGWFWEQSVESEIHEEPETILPNQRPCDPTTCK